MTRCTYCGSNAHPISHCPKTWGGSAARTNLRCGYCGDRKHDIHGCPKKWSERGAGVRLRD